jgi:hypothetical protein
MPSSSDLPVVGGRLAAITNREKASESQGGAAGVDQVDHAASRGGDQQASHGRSRDAGNFHRTAVPGDGVAQRIRRNDVLQESLTGGPLERASQCEKEQAAVDNRHRAESGEKRDGGDERHYLGEDQGAAAVVAVSHVSGEQREKKERRDLHEANISEHQSGARLRVEIPANGKRQHLRTEVGEEQSGKQQPIVAGSKRGVCVQVKTLHGAAEP